MTGGDGFGSLDLWWVYFKDVQGYPLTNLSDSQLIATRSLRGLGGGLRPARWLGIAYSLPIVYTLPVYVFTWNTGLGTLLNPYVFSP